jgi:3-dehydroquinate dehydratase-2
VTRLLVLHGPNLNLLGSREPEVYGSITLAQIDERLLAEASRRGVDLRCVQSNHEGVLVDEIQGARGSTMGIIINPGAYGHTSIAIRDAIAAVNIPVVEVHISNVHAREQFRHHLVLSPVCRGVIAGLGWRGYLHALDSLLDGN